MLTLHSFGNNHAALKNKYINNMPIILYFNLKGTWKSQEVDVKIPGPKKV